MKVLIVVTSLSSGGAERVACNLANSWNEAGNTVSVLTIAAAHHDFYSLDEGIRRTSLDSTAPSANLLISIKRNAQRFLKLRRAMEAEQADLVLALMTTTAVSTLISSCFLQVPVVVAEHNYPPRSTASFTWNVLRKIFYRRAISIVALNESSAQWLREHTFAKRVVSIPNAIVWPLPDRAPIVPVVIRGDERKLFLSVGRLEQQKAFDRLIRSFAAIANELPEWDLVIIGEGDDRQSLLDLIHENSLQERVELVGRVGNVSDWYKASDVFVLSSEYEGFPGALLEAMSSGRTVVAVDCLTGPKDIIDHEVNGLITEKTDHSLAQGMFRCASDDELRKRLSMAATSVLKTYSESRVLALWKKEFASFALDLKTKNALTNADAIMSQNILASPPTQPVFSFLIPSFRGGGAEKVMIEIANKLAQRGFCIHLVVVDASGPYANLVEHNVEIHDLAQKNVMASILPLARYMKKVKPSSLIATMMHVNVASAIAAVLARSSVLLVAREALPISRELNQGYVLALLAKMFYRRFDAHVSMTKCQQKDRQSSIRVKQSSQEYIIGNPIDYQELTRQGELEPEQPLPVILRGMPLIVACGRLTDQKGFDNLIRAFACVRQQINCGLLILGEGEQRPQLELLAEELGVSNSIWMPGFMNNPHPYTRLCSVFVLSSEYEGMPNALLQAYITGTNCVATDCACGPSEILCHSGISKLVPIGNIQAMCDAIVEMIETDPFPEASADWRTKFHIDTVADSYGAAIGVNSVE